MAAGLRLQAEVFDSDRCIRKTLLPLVTCFVKPRRLIDHAHVGVLSKLSVRRGEGRLCDGSRKVSSNKWISRSEGAVPSRDNHCASLPPSIRPRASPSRASCILRSSSSPILSNPPKLRIFSPLPTRFFWTSCHSPTTPLQPSM